MTQQNNYCPRGQRTNPMTAGLRNVAVVVILGLLSSPWFITSSYNIPLWFGYLAWSVGQWTPTILSDALTRTGWASFERHEGNNRTLQPLEIPFLDLSSMETRRDPLKYLQTKYGKDWSDKPLLLRGIWTKEELQNKSRSFSLDGLLKESIKIPYFTDARSLALTPDAEGPIREIVRRILDGEPHKIGSQLYIQQKPELLSEVAPLKLVTLLFGDRFQAGQLLGHITSPINLIKGPLTVPMFVANGEPAGYRHDGNGAEETCDVPEQQRSNGIMPARPFTGLHCEPIGNVAMNLHGAREWMLVEPRYSHLLRPAVSPDSRGFFASWAPHIEHVPRYTTRTLPGDALWVPPWTWHQVMYVSDPNVDGTVAMGASLFHFRPLDFVLRNPLYAFLLTPYLVGEFLGSKSQ